MPTELRNALLRLRAQVDDCATATDELDAALTSAERVAKKKTTPAHPWSPSGIAG